MPTGLLKTWFPDKGFGFIAPDDRSADVFAHARQLTGEREAAQNLKEGMRLTFETEWDEKKGKPKASTWTAMDALGGGACSGGCGGTMGGAMPGGFAPSGAMPQQSFGMAGPGYGAAALAGSGSQNRFDPYGSSPGAVQPAGGFSPYGTTAPAGCGGFQTGVGGGAGFQATSAAPMQPQAALPPGWEQATDPASGKVYYFNRSTNETTWTLPTGSPGPETSTYAQPSPTQPMQPEQAAQATQASQPEQLPQPTQPQGSLPAGWEKATDPTSGKEYYFNRSTNATQWHPP
eukprot:CAMPEP_0117523974 /NCGR_PEP_ID=MMETSP0784-20121206/35003_1 /TAXON_ID=39447 /ORGANISM="" /LENGTH=288 /DNA_ID=CAMNT_0005320101 /DNA_START=22 /DNA_END=888 /DNA_ORIENTATION=-